MKKNCAHIHKRPDLCSFQGIQSHFETVHGYKVRSNIEKKIDKDENQSFKPQS